MSETKQEEELDIKAIDSFFIVIKRNSERLNDSKLPESQETSQVLQQQSISESPPTELLAIPTYRLSMDVGQASNFLKKRSQIKENIQKCQQMRLKYQHLLKKSPTKIRASSSGRLEQNRSQKKEDVQYLDYAQKNKKLRETKSKPLIETTHRKKEQHTLYPHLRMQPYLLSVYSKQMCLNLYILKPIRKNPKYQLFLCQELNSKIVLTLKMVKKHALDTNYATKLLKEIKMQAFFSHPNIAKLYHVLHDKNFVYVLYEPTMRDDLATKLKQEGPFKEKELRGVVRQIGSAIEYLHKLDILHLKLRLQNIYMQEDVVKIAVFEDSVHLPLLRNERMPSIHVGKDEKLGIYDTKMDIWDIGILTYQLMFGKLPVFIHPHQNEQKGYLSKASGNIYFPNDTECSASLKEFIEGCLQQNPYKRFNLRQMNQHPFLRGGDVYRWTLM